ncbi:TIGR03085 family metal-binding protein [Actinophytocola glycyrrhizae]|uniref:TIGR03085 family metal-binding protein n=1 Tax=Actinophytocola glycyrrhizae TaxID=2044873 RepID=A0ABV9S598_9PSEU
MSVAADERAALCDLLEELGPDQPTLCAGWRTRDLAAHLVVREHRPDAAPGILLPVFAGHTKRVQDSYARRPWPELVAQVRGGPPVWWPTRVPAVGELVNSVEMFVHHEDVRRGQEGWAPRDPDAKRDAAVWTGLKRAGRMTLRRSPVGLVLRRPESTPASHGPPGGDSVVVKRGPDTVTITGEPGELLLFAFGRDAAVVEFDGDQPAIAAVRGLNRGL